MSKSTPPTLDYWHVWTDDSVSCQTCCTLSGFEKESMGDADLQWNLRLDTARATVVFAELPAGWTGDWHESPVTACGRAFLV